MPQYTMRPTWPGEDRTDDYVFRVDGQEAGRCYYHYLSISRGYCWHWTVYGSSLAGDELTLAEAQAKFKAAFERKAAVLKCTRCEDIGWVCENHDDKPWREGPGGCSCGAGAPCSACNVSNADHPPRDPSDFERADE